MEFFRGKLNMCAGVRVLVMIVVFSTAISLYLYLALTHRSPRKAHDDVILKLRKANILRRMTESPPFEKWIVVTTISAPTADVAYLAEIAGWKVVVVGDRKTPPDWAYKNCIFLDIEKQKSLGFRTVELLPEGSYSRKAVGFLYAIAHGAKVIYETDDDNRPLDKLKNFFLERRVTALLYAGKNLFNPYRHFGQPTLWPRGYPLGSIGENVSNPYLLSTWNPPLIQQGLVNGDPDMDAIFRLTRKMTSTVLNVTFDSHAPPVILPAGVFAPFNTQNTLYLYDAFWGLFIPTTTAFRVCDIWRGYWAQRLLWEIGGNLGFFPANAFQKRTPHSYFDDYIQEKQFYEETRELIAFLRLWKCPSDLSFFECVSLLSINMAEKGFWKTADADLVKAWITDLRSLGYTEPKRLQMNLQDVIAEQRPDAGRFKQNIGSNVKRILQSTNSYSPVKHLNFWAQVQPSPSLYSAWKDSKGASQHTDKIRRLCPTISMTLPTITPKTTVRTFPEILLIIVYNFPFLYKNIPAMMDMYASHFPQILHCGSDIEVFRNVSSSFPSPVSFIAVDLHGGFFNYRCMLQAMKMRYSVRGYFLVGDDVLLNVWNFNSPPRDKIWFIESMGTLYNRDNFTINWVWWNYTYGRPAYNNAMKELKGLDQDGKLYPQFLKTLEKNTGGKNRLYKAGGDFIYIPKVLQEEFLFFMEVFSKHNLFLEIALPLIVAGLRPSEDIYILKGSYLWYDGKREKYWEFFNPFDFFIHPVKWGLEHKKPTGYSFLCKTFLPLTLS